MTDYDNTNTGALFKNDKDGNEKRPDYRGQGNLGGVEFWMSAWIQTSKKDGSKFMSFKFKPKTEAEAAPKTAAKPAPAKTGGHFDDMADDIPF